MFPINTSLLPPLATRKALLVVDAQNDFLAEDGALPVTVPIGLSQKISELANDFRRNGGEIIWVQSQFAGSRPVEEEQIMVSNLRSSSACAAPSRGRRSRATPPVTEPALSPEAFLTTDASKGLTCVKAGSPGTEMHPVVKQAVGPKDFVLIKTFYSAFKVEELLRVLRVKFVTELFICGSMINVGVMATAIDAASYGYTITIVDDCCGAQSMSRHRTTLGQITNTTGCDTLSAAKVLSMMKPKPTSPERVDNQHQHQHQDAAGSRSPTVRLRRGKKDAIAPSASDIQPSFERLSLSGEPAAADEHAPTTIARPQQRQQQQRSESKPRSQSQSPSALHNDTKNSKNPNVVVNKERHKPIAIESLTTTNHATSSSSSKESFEPLETPPTLISTMPKANTTASRDHPNPNNTSDSKDQNRIMTLQPPQPDAQSSPLCEGDTKVIYNILPEALSGDIFARIRSEVAWQRMSHQGGEVPRLVAVQGLVEGDGSKPVYRHPADESPSLHPFTPTVDVIRAVVEKQLSHPLNHVLIQLYRAGTDYISEHSDKTLDITRDSFIANVSLGAERTMTLRTKRKRKDSQPRSREGEEGVRREPNTESGHDDDHGLKRQVQRARLPHNSLFQMGLATNARWLHGIRQDKRAARDKVSAELAYDGARISLTFRQIGTFLTGDETRIWGQGATAKTREGARSVVNGLGDSAIAMLKAFGRENQDAGFNWAENYGAGFDVLHITTAKRLFLSGDAVVNLRLRSLMTEMSVSYARGNLSGGDDRDVAKCATVINAPEAPVKFVDNNEAKTVVLGQRDIMLYIEKTYGGKETSNNERVVSERFEQGLGFLNQWRSVSLLRPPSTPHKEKQTGEDGLAIITGLLALWEVYATEGAFIAGPEPSLADYAFWPVLHDIFSSGFLSSLLEDYRSVRQGETRAVNDNDEDDEEKEKRGEKLHFHFPHLRAYNDRMQARGAIAQILSH
ncbi:hypothetical protein F5Y12DRAFT_782549 [Xylaria sp. FL1777]|nr:hypothetical protein F5Y12DRAFT_782549 [Xylaria sp. FL1777]